MLTSNLAVQGSVVTDKTIDSQSLLTMVNQARISCNEKAVRNNVFIDRIKDELEGETYKIFVGQKNGSEIEVAEMTIKQAIRVAARESKAVRRALVDKLEAMQLAHIEKNKSGNGLVEYRLAKAEQLKAMALEKNIASARDLMAMFPRLGDSANQVIVATLVNPLMGSDIIPLPVIDEHYHTAGEVGVMLGVSSQKIGRVANANNLKTELNGKFFLDKSRHSDKQVETFRYNAEGVKALRHFILGADVA
ncbi:hypothetical protein [Erwinia phyllosphaerae]|uniref:hypothetical protein n=1 Tax=Erwinia phyllosphaerae TaxID=2853256 RepID=UPI001FEEECC3|nr:hypothetical protein [Erwinia phyllosphaerae]MBV4365935.1 hypothetical protein [Erwinia phyllosphaerae]